MSFKNRPLYIAGTGNLGKSLGEGLTPHFKSIHYGQRIGPVLDGNYQIGELPRLSVPEGSVGIIATTLDGVMKALRDFRENQIPTIIATSGIDHPISKDLDTHGIPIMRGSNTTIPVVELLSIFNDTSLDLRGYFIQVYESHPITKIDSSGTATDMISRFLKLGGVWNEGNIEHRSREDSLEFGVNEKFLDAHAYHTYEIFCRSSASSIAQESFELLGNRINEWSDKYSDGDYSGFQSHFFKEEGKITFSHNVDGRDIYARGILGVLQNFLDKGPRERVYDITECI